MKQWLWGLRFEGVYILITVEICLFMYTLNGKGGYSSYTVNPKNPSSWKSALKPKSSLQIQCAWVKTLLSKYLQAAQETLLLGKNATVCRHRMWHVLMPGIMRACDIIMVIC